MWTYKISNDKLEDGSVVWFAKQIDTNGKQCGMVAFDSLFKAIKWVDNERNS